MQIFVKIKFFILKRLSVDTILRSFIKGSFWTVYGTVVFRGCSLIASIFIARFLGNVNFGELSIIKTTISVFSLLANFGLGVSMTKYVAKSINKDAKELGRIIAAANKITITTGLFFGLLLVIFAPYIAHHLLKAENLSIPLRIGAIYLFFNALNVYQVGVILGLEAFKPLARVNLIMGVITLPILLSTTFFYGLQGALIGLVINTAINWYLNRSLILKITTQMGVYLDHDNLHSEILQLLRFNYPLAIKEIIYSVSNWACFYLLLIKTNYGEVGIYNSANQLFQLVLFLPGIISSVFLSFLSKQTDNYADYRKLIKRNILFTIAVTSVTGIILIAMSKLIYQFYGSSYVGGKEILFILVIASIPMSLVNVFEQVFISISKPKLVMIFQLIIQFLTISTLLILFYFYSQTASSLAYSKLISYSIAAVLMYLCFLKLKAINTLKIK